MKKIIKETILSQIDLNSKLNEHTIYDFLVKLSYGEYGLYVTEESDERFANFERILNILDVLKNIDTTNDVYPLYEYKVSITVEVTKQAKWVPNITWTKTDTTE